MLTLKSKLHINTIFEIFYKSNFLNLWFPRSFTTKRKEKINKIKSLEKLFIFIFLPYKVNGKKLLTQFFSVIFFHMPCITNSYKNSRSLPKFRTNRDGYFVLPYCAISNYGRLLAFSHCYTFDIMLCSII